MAWRPPQWHGAGAVVHGHGHRLCPLSIRRGVLIGTRAHYHLPLRAHVAHARLSVGPAAMAYIVFCDGSLHPTRLWSGDVHISEGAIVQVLVCLSVIDKLCCILGSLQTLL